jgi:hypothetical protein
MHYSATAATTSSIPSSAASQPDVADGTASVKDKMEDSSAVTLPTLKKEPTLQAAKEWVALDARQKRKVAAHSLWARAYEWMSVYRIFHTLILVVNVTGIGFTLSYKWDTGRERAATFGVANVLAALLARNEVFLRFVYWVLLLVFSRWPPVWFRYGLSQFMLNIGGFHSGFAVSGTLWVVAAVVEFYRQGAPIIHPSILALSVVSLAGLLAVCASAWPSLRLNHHNVFENIHRLIGWSSLVILWVLVGLADSWQSLPPRTFSATRLASKPDIYMVTAITIIIFLPWTSVRKVPVDARVLSRSVVQLNFPGQGCGPGLFARIARHPLHDSHAFGITSFGPDTGSHYLIVVGQGDFTRDLIANPPTQLWTRQFKFAGLPYLTSMFRSGLYVVTGTAIGVGLSFILQPHPRSRWHLLWIAAHIEETYEDTVLADLQKAIAAQAEARGEKVDPSDPYDGLVTVWDTRKRGRPELGQFVVDTVKAQSSEVVICTSNPKGTADILRSCRQQGIPASGPIWDS